MQIPEIYDRLPLTSRTNPKNFVRRGTGNGAR
jgi:hypothetical protein